MTNRRTATNLRSLASRLVVSEDGTVFVEYLLLLTIVGIGAIAGLATLRGALTSELIDLAEAIATIN